MQMVGEAFGETSKLQALCEATGGEFKAVCDARGARYALESLSDGWIHRTRNRQLHLAVRQTQVRKYRQALLGTDLSGAGAFDVNIHTSFLDTDVQAVNRGGHMVRGAIHTLAARSNASPTFANYSGSQSGSQNGSAIAKGDSPPRGAPCKRGDVSYASFFEDDDDDDEEGKDTEKKGKRAARSSRSSGSRRHGRSNSRNSEDDDDEDYTEEGQASEDEESEASADEEDKEESCESDSDAEGRSKRKRSASADTNKANTERPAKKHRTA